MKILEQLLTNDIASILIPLSIVIMFIHSGFDVARDLGRKVLCPFLTGDGPVL